MRECCRSTIARESVSGAAGRRGCLVPMAAAAKGIRPERVIFAGDSAGGGLALAAMIALRAQGEALPAAAVCMSPLTDLAHEGDSMRTRAKLDPLVQLASSTAHPHCYVGDLKAPLASPLYANLRGLPPTLILVG